MMKRLIIFAAFFICSLLMTFAQYSGSGNGTEDDPYLIYNETQFYQMSNFLNQPDVVFSLKKDLNLTDWIDENSPTEGWQPIGVSSTPFMGKLIGNGKTISGLKINRGSSSYIGLFGYLAGATISDLSIKGTTIVGGQYTGTLAGYATGTTLTNVSIEMSTLTLKGTQSGGLIGYAGYTNISTFSLNINAINSSESHAGGLIGKAENCTFNDGSINTTLNGIENLGGMIGEATNSTVDNVTITSNVSSTSSNTGGVIGAAITVDSLTNVIINGDVSGNGNVGGIIGIIKPNSSITLVSCKSKGKVINVGDFTGGLIGKSDGSCIGGLESCSHFGDIKGLNYVGGLVGAIYNTVSTPTLHYYYANDSKDEYNQPDGKSRGSWSDKIVNKDIEEKTAVSNCISIGNIEGINYLGGLIGLDVMAQAYIPSTTEQNIQYERQTFTGMVNTYNPYVWKDGEYIGNKSKIYITTYTHTSLAYSLTNCYYSGNISGTEYIGGLVGEKQGGLISKCYSYGNVKGSNYVGGVVGNVTTYTSTLQSNVVNSTTISASSTDAKVGRIYGEGGVNAGANGTSTGNRALTTCKLIKSGVTQTVSDDVQNGLSTGISLLRLKATYVAMGWDFENDWNILETECFPYKTYQAAPPVIGSNLTSGATTISGQSVNGGTVYLFYKDNAPISTICSGNDWSFPTEALQSGAQVQVYADVEGMAPSYLSLSTVGFPGSGTEEDPWRIYTAYDLQGVAKPGYYKLMNDIDLTDWINTNSPTNGWIAIGLNSGDGVYIDGNNYKVSGLWTDTSDDYTGLFSNYSVGEIKNLNVEVATGKKVKGGNFTGILIGRMANGNITNCTVSGEVEGSMYTGGIAGYTTNTTLSMLDAEGEVTGTTYVGGITGHAQNADITSCTTNSTITTTGISDITYVGGLVGYADCNISNSNATSTINGASTSANYYVGGLVGQSIGTITKSSTNTNISVVGNSNRCGGLVGNFSGTVSLSYALGSLTASGSASITGGLVGYADNSSITDSYSTANISSTDYNGGVIGYALNTSIERCYAKGDVSGVQYGGGLVAQLDGSSAQLSNSVAANNILSLTSSSSWGSRVLGGYKNGASEPEENNYALSTMQVSLNGVAQKKTDDPVEGIAKSAAELTSAATYQGLGWDFSSVWGITENANYPYLRWELQVDPVTEITLNKSSLILAAGESETLTANVLPQKATNKNLTWTSSDESVATVVNGTVTAVAEGTATITVAAIDGSGVTATCEVTVTASKEETIAQLQEIVNNAQALYDNSTEGENVGEYPVGSRAELLAVINDVQSRISSSMSNEEISACTEDINAAINHFKSLQVTAGEDTDISGLDNVIYIDRVEALSGTQMNLSIKMKNSAPIRSFQFDLYLPNGVTVATTSKGKVIASLNQTRLPEDDEHTLGVSVEADGAIRFLCGSLYDETFTGTDGEIVTLTVNIADDMNEGEYPILLKKITLSETDISKFYETSLIKTTLAISNYTLGDINGDGIVNVSDYTGVANHILGMVQTGFNSKAADVNSDNTINVSDYTGIANIILTGNIYGQKNNLSPKFSIVNRMPTDLSSKDNIIYVEPVTLSAGKQAKLSFKMKNSASIRSFQFDLYLPDGVTVQKSSSGKIAASLNQERLPEDDEHTLGVSIEEDGAIRFLCGSLYDETFTGTDGEIVSLTVNIADNMNEGEYPIILKTMTLSETDISKFYYSDYIETTLTIGSDTIVLDENSTVVPAATTDDVDIKVKRTIYANEWSTLCLPFDMTEEQIYAAFGNDVELAEFESYDAEYDTNDNVTSITVNFANTNLSEGLYANNPYVIRTKQDISEFNVKATIQPDEENAVVEYDNGKTGKRREVYGTFYGTYHADTEVPADALFLSGNKFYYSTGLTKMQAFRGYFVFEDVLLSTINSSTIGININDVMTNIPELLRSNDKNVYYDLQGRRVLKPTNGVYILNGKKLYVK